MCGVCVTLVCVHRGHEDRKLESRSYGELVELVWSGEIVSVWVYQVYV